MDLRTINEKSSFDLFHTMKLAGEALDVVRKNLRKQGADLTGGLWAVRGNEWTRSQEQLDLRSSRCKATTLVSARVSTPGKRLIQALIPKSGVNLSDHVVATPAGRDFVVLRDSFGRSMPPPN